VECSQFILEFPLEPDYSFDSFIATGKNRLIINEIINLKNHHDHSLTLTGLAGSGKTHLLHAAISYFQAENKTKQTTAVYLDIAALVSQVASHKEGDLAQLLTRYKDYCVVAIDELEKLENQPPLQEAVLFLFNQVISKGGKLLFASRISPNNMDWLRKDLSSRLLWGEVFTITPPCDDELGEILTKMAHDRQVKLSPELINFLQLRLPRRVPDYGDAMEKLDRAGKGLKQKITVPLAKKVLGF
jgi:DnaA-homolog protein